MSEDTEPEPEKEIFAHDGWKSFKEAAEAVQECVNGDWSWMRNGDCKYVSVRVDMRDGHCIIKDRYGKVIDLDKLKHQHERE